MSSLLHLFRPRVLPNKIFLLLGIYTWDSFYTFDLDTFQSPSMFKSPSSSVRVNSLMNFHNLTEVEKFNCQPASVCYSVQCQFRTVAEYSAQCCFLCPGFFWGSSVLTNSELPLFVSGTTEKRSGSYHTHGSLGPSLWLEAFVSQIVSGKLKLTMAQFPVVFL